MQRLARALLCLYPPAWRRRYGDEVAEVIASRQAGLRDVVDLVFGAMDARLHPQPIATLDLAVVGGPASAEAAFPPPQPARPSHGAVPGPRQSLLSRRRFMRQMLGAGVGLLSLEFAGGTLAFLWPRPTGGLGVEHAVGTLEEIAAVAPDWTRGRPWEFKIANAFLVNVPAAKAWAGGESVEVADPSQDEILALWRKCPHLGCMIPPACEDRGRFQCYCHQSTYNILGEKLELGPAPRGMDRFPVRIDEDGVLHVDTREVISGAPEGVVTFRDPWPPDQGCA